MTVQDLIDELLSVENRDRVVVMQKDGEGNGYSPLECTDDSVHYQAETTWSGEVGYAELTPELEERGYGEEDILDDGRPALVLVPVN
jgi:hypothetical protein